MICHAGDPAERISPRPDQPHSPVEAPFVVSGLIFSVTGFDQFILAFRSTFIDLCYRKKYGFSTITLDCGSLIF